MDINKYIGIPFKNLGRDFDGCDCYGLVRLFLMEEFGETLPEFLTYADAMNPQETSVEIVANVPLLDLKRVSDPVTGNIAVMKYYNYPCHVGIYVGKNKILHVMRNTASVCEKLNSTRLRGRLEGFYAI